MEFLVESPAAFAPSTCPGATGSSHSLYSMEVPKEWGAGYLTAVKLWESHHHPPHRQYNKTMTTQTYISMLKQNSSCKSTEASQHPVFQQLVSPRLLTDVHFDSSPGAQPEDLESWDSFLALLSRLCPPRGPFWVFYVLILSWTLEYTN